MIYRSSTLFLDLKELKPTVGILMEYNPLTLLVVKLIVASCLQSCGQPKDFFYLFIATKDC
jgi:hypothetical protein